MSHLAILTRQIGHYHDARYRAAAARFDQLTVISTANEGGFKEFLAKDVGAYNITRLFDDKKDYDAALMGSRLAGKLISTLSALMPNAIAVAGWANAESAIAIRWAVANRVPIVLMSESQMNDAQRSFIREKIKGRIVSLCDTAIVGGPSHRDYVEQLGLPKGRTHLGYNAVDNDYFEKESDAARGNAERLRKEHDLPDRYILASGRFIPKKNFPALVTAYAQAIDDLDNDSGPDLIILGDGETRPEISASISRHQLYSKVHLLGYRGYELLPVFYGLAEAFVHVSLVEQWGLVVNEAMASALPVIVSEPCGVGRAVIEKGVSGFIVDPTVPSMADALKNFMQMPTEQRQDMGCAARKAIAEFGPEQFGEGMLAAVKQASDIYQPKSLMPWDRFILKRMERTIVQQVA